MDLKCILNSLDKTARDYSNKFHLIELYEAFMSSLYVMKPNNPLRFITSKLTTLNCNVEIAWDMFIDEELKPKQKKYQLDDLDELFDLDELDENFQKMKSTAIIYYQKKILKKTFKSIKSEYLRKKAKKSMIKAKEDLSLSHWKKNVLKRSANNLKKWKESCEKRRNTAETKLKSVMDGIDKKYYLGKWREYVYFKKHKQEYIENLVRINQNEGDEQIDCKGKEENLSNINRKDNFLKLPFAIKIKILHYLDPKGLIKFSNISTSWREFIQNKFILNKLNFSMDQKSYGEYVDFLSKNNSILMQLNLRSCSFLKSESLNRISFCKNLQDLNLSQVNSLDDSRLLTILENCSILIYLNVSSTNITDSSLAVISGKLQNLMYLSLMNCHGITNEGLKCLSKGKASRTMVYLDLTSCHLISDDGLSSIINEFSKLLHIILDDLPRINGKALESKSIHKFKTISLVGSNIDAIYNFFKQLINCEVEKENSIQFELERLLLEEPIELLEGYLDEPDSYETNSVSIKSSHLNQQHSIQENYFSSKITADSYKTTSATSIDNHITNNGYDNLEKASHALPSNMEHLKHLRIVQSLILTDFEFSLFSNCPLNVLNLSNCYRLTDDGLISLLDGQCSCSLRELILNNCMRLTCRSVETIIKRCKCLSYLSLNYCLGINSQGLQLLGQLTNLSYLDIDACQNNDQSVAALATIGHLKGVSMSHSVQVSNVGLKKLIQSARNLERLDVSFSKLVSDESIKILSVSCYYMTYLNLSGCSLITDKSCQYISNFNVPLETLKLSALHKISDKSLFALKSGCKNLQMLNIQYCPKITLKAVEKIRKKVKYVLYCKQAIPDEFPFVFNKKKNYI